MVRPWLLLLGIGLCLASCIDIEPAPRAEPCVDGEYYDDDGGVYFVVCPVLDATRCKTSIKIIMEVHGFGGGPFAKVIVRSIVGNTVDKFEKLVGLQNQRFYLKLSHKKIVPTRYIVTFELQNNDCIVNGEMDYFSYEVDPICGGQIDLKFVIVCGRNPMLY